MSSVQLDTDDDHPTNLLDDDELEFDSLYPGYRYAPAFRRLSSQASTRSKRRVKILGHPFAPVHLLPNEILSCIFHLFLEGSKDIFFDPRPLLGRGDATTYYHNSLLLRLVCKRWNTIILGTPGFWTLVSALDTTTAISRILERSGTTVLLDVAIVQDLDTPVGEPRCVEFMTQIIPLSPRWKSLQLMGLDEGDKKVAELVKEVLKSPAPALDYYAIWGKPLEEGDLSTPLIPAQQVTDLQLQSTVVPWSSLASLGGRLRNVAIHSCRSSNALDVLSAVYNMPCLVNFDVFTEIIPVYTSELRWSKEKIRLPYLRHVAMVGEGTAQVLDHIVIPPEASINISTLDSDPSRLLDTLNRHIILTQEHYQPDVLSVEVLMLRGRMVSISRSPYAPRQEFCVIFGILEGEGVLDKVEGIFRGLHSHLGDTTVVLTIAFNGIAEIADLPGLLHTLGTLLPTATDLHLRPLLPPDFLEGLHPLSGSGERACLFPALRELRLELDEDIQWRTKDLERSLQSLVEVVDLRSSGRAIEKVNLVVDGRKLKKCIPKAILEQLRASIPTFWINWVDLGEEWERFRNGVSSLIFDD